jgi:phenylacetate-CoA ligase
MRETGLERASPAARAEQQLARLNRLLREILPANRFYSAKLGSLPPALGWEDFRRLPFTHKAELVEDQERSPPLGTLATYPAEEYVAWHQTSGTTGRPLAVCDTRESWDWWSDCWQSVYAAAGVTRADRVFFAFSFGPFIGFWSAYDAARRLGALCIPGGALDSRGRLQLLRQSRASVLLCTVTYALRLAEVARAEGIDTRELGVRTAIHAGEPGASIPAVRARVEEAWGARCFDHAGATEVGAYAFSCEARDGLHVNEEEFIVEILDEEGRPVSEGERGELVLTNLGRAGWPVIRYRTGDLAVAGPRGCGCGRTLLKLPGGLVGRADDLMIVRGVNVYPSAIEAIVHEFEVAEFRMVRSCRDSMEELLVEVEGSAEVARALRARLNERLGLRLQTRAVAAGSLPRFELKARRVVDERDRALTHPA